MGQVRTTFTSEDKDVQKALDQMTKSLQKYVEENRKLKQETKQASESGKGFFESQARAATAMVAQYIGVRAVLQEVNRELERRSRLETEAANRARGAAATQSDFLNNLGLVSQDQQRAALARVRAIAQRTGRPEQDLYGAASVAVSARGGMSVTQSLDAVEQAARLTTDPGSMAQLSGAFLDIASLTKTPQANVNAGFLLALQAQSRVASQQQIAQNLVPSALGIAARGGTPAEAAALASTLTSIMKDQTGAISGTAGIQLANQLATFLPEGGSTVDRIRALQQDPGRAQAFLEKASFEQKSRFAIEQLLSGGTAGAQLLEQNIQAFPGNQQLGRDFERFIGNKQAVSLQRSDLDRMRLGQVVEEFQLDNTQGQRAAAIREQLNQVLEEVGTPDWFGYGPLSWRMRDFNRAVAKGTEPAEAALGVLRRRSGQLDIDDREQGLIDRMIAELEKQTAELEGIRGNQNRGVDPERHRE
jgi:hypothetical protein